MKVSKLIETLSKFDSDDNVTFYFLKNDTLTYDEQIEIRDQNLGVWEADNEDDMIDEITAATGYLINNIYSDIQLK